MSGQRINPNNTDGDIRGDEFQNMDAGIVDAGLEPEDPDPRAALLPQDMLEAGFTDEAPFVRLDHAAPDTSPGMGPESQAPLPDTQQNTLPDWAGIQAMAPEDPPFRLPDYSRDIFEPDADFPLLPDPEDPDRQLLIDAITSQYLDEMEDAAPDAAPDMGPEELPAGLPDHLPGRNAGNPEKESQLSGDVEPGRPLPYPALESADDPVSARRNARLALLAAGEMSPELIAASERTAQSLGIPASLAYNNKKAQAEVTARRLAENPDLNRWAGQSARNAAIAAANAGWAGNVARAFAPFRQGGALDLELEDSRRAARDLVAHMPSLARNTAYSFWNGLVSLSTSLWSSMSSLAELFTGDRSEISRFLQKQVETGRDMQARLPADASGIENFWYDVVGNIPQLAGSVGIAASGLGAGLSLATSTGLSSLFMGNHIYGQSYDELRERGISARNAAFAAAVNASLQIPMEMLSIGRFTSLFLKPHLSLARSIGEGAATEFFTEAMQKAPEYASHAWAESSLHADGFMDRLEWFADYVTDRENFLQATGEAIYEGLVGAALGGGMGAMPHVVSRRRLAGEREELRQREAAIEAALADARNLSAAMTARKMLDSAFSQAQQARISSGDRGQAIEVMENSLPESVRQLWISAGDMQGLFQRHGRQAVESALGLDAQAVDAALQNQSPLKVRTALVLYSDEAPEARDALRLEPDGPSHAEAGAFSPEGLAQRAAAMLDGDADAYTDREDVNLRARAASALVQARAGARREMTRIRKELAATGMTREEARAHGDYILAHAMAFYQNYGMDPQAMLSRLFNFQAGGKSDAGHRGQVAFNPDGTALITLFKGADVSTTLHEAFHVFIDNLRAIAADDGSTALERFNGNMEMLRRALPCDEMEQAHARAMEIVGQGADLGAATSEIARTFRRMARQARQEQAEALAREEEQQTEAKQADHPNAPKTPFELLTEASDSRLLAESRNRAAMSYARIANLAARASRHLAGLEQARADYATLAREANFDPAHATDEDYRRLQEYGAARAVAYLAGGRAPSMGLSGMFQRMSGWLGNLFSGTEQGQVSPELAAVFDRLLTTERERAELSAFDAATQLELQMLDDSPFTEAERKKLAWQLERNRLEVYEILRGAANEEAPIAGASDNPLLDVLVAGNIRRSDAISMLGVEDVKKIEKVWPDLFKVDGEPVEVITSRHEGVWEEGGLGLFMDIYEQVLGNGLGPRKAASLRNREMTAARLAEKRALVRQRQMDFYSQLLTRIDEVLARKIAGLATKDKKRVLDLAFMGTTPQNVIDSMASQEMLDTPIGSISQAQYRQRLNKALSERAKALADGDVFRARDELTRARIASKCLAMAYEIEAAAGSFYHLAGKVAAQINKYPEKHVEILARIFQTYSLPAMRQTPNPQIQSMLMSELVQEIQQEEMPDAVEPALAGWVLQLADPQGRTVWPHGRVNWRNLSMNQLRDLEDVIRHITHLGRNENSREAEAEKGIIRRAADECVARMSTLADLTHRRSKTLEDMRRVKECLFRSVDLLRFQFAKADGMTDILGSGGQGPMGEILNEIQKQEGVRRGLVERFVESAGDSLRTLADAARRLNREHGRYLRDAGGHYLPVPEGYRKAYNVPSWTPDMLLALAFNLGNDSNIQRLKAGYKDLSPEAVGYLLGDAVALRMFRDAYMPRGHNGLLTSREWQAVQQVWDSLAMFWPDTVATHRKLLGFSPTRLPIDPLRVIGSDGQAVELKGGYYPVQYDGSINGSVRLWTEKEDLLARNDSMLGSPRARRSFTKSRAAGAPGLPVLLSTEIIANHVFDATTFIALAPITRRAWRITRVPEFRQQYVRVYGQEDYDAIMPNLRGLVLREPPTRFDEMVKMADRVRKYLVPWALAWNIKVAAIQFTAIFPAMGDIGARPVLNGLMRLVTSPRQTMNAIRAASPYMMSRIYAIDQDIQGAQEMLTPRPPARLRMGSREINYEELVNAGMQPIVMVDMAATSAIWLGAYDKYCREHQAAPARGDMFARDEKLHSAAVMYADNVVKNSNPDFDNSSRSGFLRARNAFRLVNAFSSAVSLFAARGHYMHIARRHGKISGSRLARFYAYDYILPGVSMFLFLGLIQGYFTGDDEPKDIWQLMFTSQMDQFSMRVPVFGGIGSQLVQSLLGINQGGLARGQAFNININTPIELTAAITRQVGKLWGDDRDRISTWQQLEKQDFRKARALEDMCLGAWRLASFLSRIPVARITDKIWKGAEQWEAGHGTPLSTVIPRSGKTPGKKDPMQEL